MALLSYPYFRVHTHFPCFTSTSPSLPLSGTDCTFGHNQLSSLFTLTDTTTTIHSVTKKLFPTFNSTCSVHPLKTHLRHNHCFSMTSSSSSWSSLEGTGKKSKRVWIWTKSKQVMAAAVERGWNTFIFPSQHQHLAHDWSCKFIPTSPF